MNELIAKLYEQATVLEGNGDYVAGELDPVKFAELIVQDYSRKAIQGLMSDPAFAQAMDEYYEQKWAYRFD